MPRTFLTAQWRYLAMLNYTIDPALVRPLVPPGTELDFFGDATYVSLVGFRFLRTKVFGLGIPGYRDFEEVNLRFYVRRRTAEGWRRGVAFVGELVPHHAIALVARTLYGEPYAALPMGHRIQRTPASIHVEYHWRRGGKWESMGVLGRGPATVDARLPRGIHCRTLLGLHHPPRQVQRVRGRTSALADLVGHGELPPRRCCSPLRPAVRGGPLCPSRLDLDCRRLGGRRAAAIGKHLKRPTPAAGPARFLDGFSLNHRGGRVSEFKKR